MAFFKLVKATNQLAALERLTRAIATAVFPAFNQMLEILGLKIPEVTEAEKREIDELIKKRNLLRSEKKFQEADLIRKQISEMGIVLIDHKSKTLWMKQEKIGIED